MGWVTCYLYKQQAESSGAALGARSARTPCPEAFTAWWTPSTVLPAILGGQLIACVEGNVDFYAMATGEHTFFMAGWAGTQVPVTFVALEPPPPRRRGSHRSTPGGTEAAPGRSPYSRSGLGHQYAGTPATTRSSR